MHTGMTRDSARCFSNAHALGAVPKVGGTLLQIIFAWMARESELSVHQNSMLMTIAVILIILWLLGVVTSFTIGGLVHILLVVAIIMILIRLIRGENSIK